jgi:uncharacterized repeat protein (TIGR01451 family)
VYSVSSPSWGKDRGDGAFLFLLSFLFILLFSSPGWSVTPSGTIISNVATATYAPGPTGSAVIVMSPVASVTTVISRTHAVIEYLQFVPAVPGAQLIPILPTAYSPGGNLNGPYAPVGAPVPAGSTIPLDLTRPVPLIPPTQYHAGEPVFIRLTDGDQNNDPAVAETVVVTIRDDKTGDTEVLRLTETGPNTGVFLGYVQSSIQPAVANNGLLSLVNDSNVITSYVDSSDPADTTTVSALVDPYGIVFNSVTGQPVDGAIVTLVNIATGGPATVYGDDGIATFPSTLTTGGTAADSGGRVYSMSPGGYRFPFINPGRYRLDVMPPAGYRSPSTAATTALQALPGAPFAIADPGSRSEEFIVNAGPAIRIDIPVDPVSTRLYLVKSAVKQTAAIGDFVPYSLTVENIDTSAPVPAVTIVDRLPNGFRYRKGSTRLSSSPVPDPAISEDGRSLTFAVGDLGAAAKADITYVAEVGAGASLGKAVNTAMAHGDLGAVSNTATATVVVTEDLFGSKTTIVGRVLDGCGDERGIAGIRIFLEDGTYVVTDKNGMYHFTAVNSGTHVVQLDTVTVPENYEVKSCEENTRFAGTQFSQFVDLQGGSLWRADFHLGMKPKVTGEVGLELRSSLTTTGTGTPDRKPNGRYDIAYDLPLQVRGVPVRKLRLIVMLPDSVTYETGSSRLNAGPIPDPELADGVLTYRLGDEPADWVGTIRFTASVPAAGTEGDLITKAFLIFDTPTAIGEKTPVVDNILVRYATRHELRMTEVKIEKESSGMKSVSVKGLLPGEAWKNDKPSGITGNSKAMPDYAESIESATPGTAWLWPPQGHSPAIASIKVVIKHDPGAQVKLLLNHESIDPVYFDGLARKSDNSVAISFWRGIHLKEGDNQLEAVIVDASGSEAGRLQRTIHYSGPPVKAILVPGRSKLIANGRNPIVLAVRFTDKDGHPAREGVLGEYLLGPPYTAQQRADELQQSPLIAPATDRLKYLIGEDGVTLIELMPTTQTGEAVLRFPLIDGYQEVRTWLKPEDRDWILVGLAEGTVGYNAVKGNMETFTSGNGDDKYFEEDRLAFYAKGRIKGEWLLTLAYDSKKAGESDQQGLYQTIDPNKYYTLYGDATQQGFDAASTKHIYLKLERDQFYALFGDYNTGLSVTELSRYNRNFTGFKSELKTDHFDYNVFLADTNQAYVRDEFPGDGTSGLYHLSKKNIMLNSETITIETRDRFRSEAIVSRQQMVRYLDYSIDYEAGTIFFKAPVYSRDGNFNPVFIVAEYESFDTGDTTYNFGGRGAVRLLDNRVEIGATHVHEGGVGGAGNLEGVDAKVKISEANTLRAEVATTKTDQTGAPREGSAYLAEIQHRSETLEGKAYMREQDEEFGLGQQNGGETGTRKVGADLNYRINKPLSVGGEVFRQNNLSTDAVRDMAEVRGRYAAGQYDMLAGLRRAEDTLATGEAYRSDQIFAGMKYQLTERTSVRIRRDQSVGSNDNNDFPTRTTIGADYKLNDASTIFADQEWTQGAQIDTATSRIGIKTSPWTGGQVGSTVEQQSTENGVRLFSTTGLKQTWQITKQWSVDAGLDRSDTIRNTTAYVFNTNVPPASGSSEDFTATSLGLGYRQERWSWTARAENRVSDSEHKFGLFMGANGEVRKGLALSAGLQTFRSNTPAGEEKANSDLRMGLVHRPFDTRAIILDRLDLIQAAQHGGTTTYDNNKRFVNNLVANFKTNSRTQVSLQYASKYVQERIDENDYRGYTDLVGLEGRYDVTKKWDVGLRGMRLRSWSIDQEKYGTGASVGFNAGRNLWISVGYNFTGFKDRDFSKADFTSEGPFIKMRMKFDQVSVRDAVKWFSGQ